DDGGAVRGGIHRRRCVVARRLRCGREGQQRDRRDERGGDGVRHSRKLTRPVGRPGHGAGTRGQHRRAARAIVPMTAIVSGSVRGASGRRSTEHMFEEMHCQWSFLYSPGRHSPRCRPPGRTVPAGISLTKERSPVRTYVRLFSAAIAISALSACSNPASDDDARFGAPAQEWEFSDEDDADDVEPSEVPAADEPGPTPESSPEPTPEPTSEPTFDRGTRQNPASPEDSAIFTIPDGEIDVWAGTANWDAYGIV